MIGSIVFSQETIQITKKQALDAVKAKQLSISLANELQQAEIKIGIRDNIIAAFKSEIYSWELDNKLLQDNYDLALTRIEALQKRDNRGYGWNDFKNDALIFFGGAVATLVVLIYL